MAAIEVPVHAAVMRDDWLAPESSLRFLLSKLPRSPVERITMDAATPGDKADHFAWIRTPEAVAAFLAQVGATPPTRGLRARGVHRSPCCSAGVGGVTPHYVSQMTPARDAWKRTPGPPTPAPNP